uniref:Uncharacterized protein n=1 Tax=Sphenodon punctatus TaxID=8508 RepID=A0A8D0GYV4_SPHPU
MASASGVSTLAEDLLCPICLSIFQEPQMLGCGHNFCLSCLESCVPKGQLEWPCPECRQLFSLQEQAPNRALASLAEKARRLKLDEMPQEGGAGGCDFCEEHDEPLKLFCTQDKGPICVICRDLPQHQGHEFLPIKNAAKLYQEKFQVCLSQLEEGRTQSYDHQIQQKESMARLESYTERLLDRISSEFKILHQLLQEKKKSLVKIAADIKEEKLSEMEGNMLYLQDNESSHMEVISLVRAALETPDCFTFLRGVKELMGRADCDIIWSLPIFSFVSFWGRLSILEQRKTVG